MRNFWILRAVALRMTKMDYHENPLDCHAKPKACLAMTNLCTRTRHCEIFARKSKQSILATLELFKNLGLYANLRLDSLIRFYYIVRIYLLTTRGLDTLLYFVSLSMTKWGVLICLWGIAIRNLLMTCDLDYSLRALRFAQNDNNFIFLTSHKEIQMIA